MITIFDNPVCEETHNGLINKKFEDYVIAFLEKLKFLNYRQIQNDRREEARERYHDELLGLHDKEAADGNKLEKDEKMIHELELMQVILTLLC
jgi:tricorn protease-like protein